MNPLTVIYLLLGHALGDFVLQGRDLAEAKRTKGTALVQHVMLVTVAHALAVIPIWSEAWLLWLPLLAVSHALIDVLKIALERRHGESLGTFALDQVLHLGCILAVAALVKTESPTAEAPDRWLTTLAVCTTAYILCTLAGSTIVRLVLARFPAPIAGDTDGDTSPARMGHAIGVLERSLGLTFILLDAWAGLGGIIAAKSIARFKDLERRHFGEYYLIGTLTSLLITVAFGVALAWALGLEG